MRAWELCFALAAVASGHENHIQTALLAIQGQISAALKPQILTTAVPSPACVAKLTEFNNATNTCDRYISAVRAFSNSTEAELYNATVDFCAGSGCQSTLSEKAMEVALACDVSVISPAQRDILRAFVAWTNAFCTTDSQFNYCYPRMKSVEVVADELANNTLDSAALDRVCTECTLKFIRIVYTTGNHDQLAAFGVLGALCLQEGTSYCALEWANLTRDAELPTDGVAPNATFIPRVCSRCARRYIYRVENLLRLFAPFSPDRVALRMFRRWTGAWCARTNTLPHQWCMHIVLNANTSIYWQNVHDKCDFRTAVCPTDCKDAVKELSNAVGCCLAPALNLINITSPVPFSLVARAVVANQCGLPLPMSCARTQLNMRIRVKNFLWAYYWANKDAFNVDLANDIAMELGYDLTTVAIGRVVQANFPTSSRRAGTVAGLDAVATVNCDTDAECNMLAGNGQSADFDSPGFSSASGDAIANPSMGISVTTQSSVGPTSGVGRIEVPALMMMALIALASLLM